MAPSLFESGADNIGRMNEIDSQEAARAELRRLTAGRVRLRTLVILRWLAIAGQVVAVLGVHFGAGFTLPLIPCLAVIGASAAMNIAVSVYFPFARRLTNMEAALYLGFDLVQLFAMLLLTGGLENPFAILFLAPVAISAASLDLKATVALVVLGFICVTILAFIHVPLPWHPDVPLILPPLYVGGTWAALVLGLFFTAGYSWRIASEGARMSTALEAARVALDKEHRMASLGGLAAAAAHELGTPLATIALVAKEIEREIGADHPLTEDVALLRSQAQRCRDILGELSRRPNTSDDHMARTPLGALLDEVAVPNQGFGGVDVEIVVTALEEGLPEPVIQRAPEVIHGLHNLVENAVDFAKTKVTVTGKWDGKEIGVWIRDDGPGFAAEILAQLGEPYVSTRRREDRDPDAPDDEAYGMGLGFFIAKTLLESTGARVKPRNPEGGGAEVRVLWPRRRIEAAPARATQMPDEGGNL